MHLTFERMVFHAPSSFLFGFASPGRHTVATGAVETKLIRNVQAKNGSVVMWVGFVSLSVSVDSWHELLYLLNWSFGHFSFISVVR